jgi:hypothetical protein
MEQLKLLGTARVLSFPGPRMTRPERPAGLGARIDVSVTGQLRHLTERQVRHRRKMLEHLSTVARTR